jgi:glycylpeptide N-tetradecanoyltransferase
MMDGLIIAKKLGIDVVTALDVMENKQFFESLKFEVGNGHLHYYFYNWNFSEMKSDDVGLVLL